MTQAPDDNATGASAKGSTDPPPAQSTGPEPRRLDKRAQSQTKKARHDNEKRKKETRLSKPAVTTPEETFAELVKVCSKHIVPADQPMALICQAPRSGGTLLRNLFDGHPQLHVHPYEWHNGHRKTDWPRLRLDDAPEVWWARLREEALGRRFQTGVRSDQSKYRGEDAPERDDSFPMLLPPLAHRDLFLHLILKRCEAYGRIETERQILDAYMTALFNGWLNNTNLRNAEKRWILAFAPRLAWGVGLDGFFGAYPDGLLISVLRDPHSWFLSSRGREIKGGENDGRIIKLWVEGTEEMIEAKRRYEDRVCIVRFDDLVRNSEGVMRLLARRLGIDYVPSLTIPTFNGNPVGTNSSYVGEPTVGVQTAPLRRHKELLSKDDRRLVADQCSALFANARTLAERWKDVPSRANAKKRQSASVA